MSSTILDELDEAKAAIETVKQEAAAGVEDVRAAIAAGIERLEKLAAKLSEDVAGAQARQFSLKLGSGREVIVSDRDALQLFAAVVVCFNRGKANLELASGVTEEFALMDLTQLAAAILAGRKG